MKILGIDYGAARIGLAVSDEDQTIAFPHSIVTPAEVFASVNTICVQEKIALIVVGLPFNLSGKPTKETQEVAEFILQLKKAVAVPVMSEDERMTSILAEALAGEKKKKRLGAGTKSAVAVDDVAAAMILQSYLDRQKH